MKRENRLKKRKEFAYVFGHGEGMTSRHIVLMTTKSKLKQFKVGFSVSKKVGNAVIRNKTKRRLKQAALTCEQKFLKGFNYIFVAKQSITDCGYEDILNEVKDLLTKFNLKNSKE